MSDREDVRFLQGDCREVLRTLPPESVHCCVTSPPYLWLRDYGVEGQIGLEATVEDYLAVLVDVFREVRRVLRTDGTLWVNIGDSYNAYNGGAGPGSKLSKTQTKQRTRIQTGYGLQCKALKPKDLMMVPARLALALQSDGWYLRSDIIWSKPNPMPESVTDRPTKAHEYLFLLAKSERYFYDADAVRDPHKELRDWPTWEERKNGGAAMRRGDPGQSGDVCHWAGVGGHPAGRNKRTVWEIPTQPTPEAHFATFPEALVTPCILAGTSERGCCSACGSPWRRQTAVSYTEAGRGNNNMARKGGSHEGTGSARPYDVRKLKDVQTTGWTPSCKCESGDPAPCVVLDPFAGSGTVGLAATKLGRRAILIDLKPDYVKLSEKRNAQVSLGL